MSRRLGYAPADPKPHHKIFSVDNSDAQVSFSKEREAGAPVGIVPEFSLDGEWRNDPTRHRPVGMSWRMPSEELKKALDCPVMETESEQEVADALTADAIISAHLYPGRRISYSRREEYWQKRVRYSGPSFRRSTVVKAVDALVAKGILIEHDRRPAGKRGTQSSYLPNPMLAAFEMPKLNRKRGEIIILRDKDGEMLAYKDTPETRDSRYVLDKVNDILERTEFAVEGEGVINGGQWTRIEDRVFSTSATAMHRVFNEGVWTSGGRFYGAFWQTMRGRHRHTILIDGERTEEVDYDYLHARIIYVWAKKKLVGDPYIIDGFERKVAKRAFFIIVNAKGYLAAKGAVSKYLEKKGLDTKRAGKLIDAIKKRHAPVEKYFHSGAGLELQNLDAKMAEYVLREMTVRKGVPCLPIHDSFIVPAGQVKNLIRTMKAAYEKFVGRANSNLCSVKSVATFETTKSMTWVPDSPHLHTLPPTTPTEVKYRTPVLGDSVLQNQEYTALNSMSSAVIETESPIPVENREELEAKQKVIKRRPMPEFMRKVIEDSQKAWTEEEARKQVKRERRLHRHQMGHRAKDGAEAIQSL
ncbi:hypothetical protein [Agrobacterium tumefaciens]|uniref:hypothetical protein n=1 Tax=Agrobacterium tumefaciens TaxID=358 RepID=UPI0015745FA9|nr:hypothetical protein [Agrobacterium tumefaciens]NTD10786.1 hypothetical protein [Agrobacterium tumefaciens]